MALSATNSFGTRQKTLILSVPGPPLYTGTTPPTSWTMGLPVAARVFASEIPTYAATGMPPGTSIDPVSGTILGAPETPGMYLATVSFTNPYGTASMEWQITVSNVAAWGNNTDGQTALPADLTEVMAVAAGEGYSVALKSDGTVAAWGKNDYGQTIVPAGLSDVVEIASGASHSLALKNDGTVIAWGRNNFSQSTVPPGLAGVVAIAAGEDFSLALKTDGTVTAWGYNIGQSSAPAGLSGVVAIAASGTPSMALRSDGTVATWGKSSFASLIAVPVGLSGVEAIAAGDQHLLALKSDGTLATWGENLSGETNVPPALSGVVAIAAGGRHSLALQSDGTLTGWGDNHSGRRTVPSGLPEVIAMAEGDDHSLALLRIADRTPAILSPRKAVATAGEGSFHYRMVTSSPATSFDAQGLPEGLTLNRSRGIITGTPAQAGSFTVSLSATNNAGTGQALLTLTVTEAAEARASNVVLWGTDPTLLGTHFLADMIAVSTGGGHSLALRENGTVAAWGYNQQGQSTVPAGLSGVMAVSAGRSHSLALKRDGTVAAWGYNNYGQCTVPAGLAEVVAISAGDDYSVGLKRDGTVVAWGTTSSGKSTVPAGLSAVVAISAGPSHTIVLKRDGTVDAWGARYSAQPLVPPGVTGVVGVSAGFGYSLMLKNDGTVAAWPAYGKNTVPASLSGVVEVAAGSDHSLALKQDGSVVAWGDNKAGQSTVPAGLSGVVALEAGGALSLALRQIPARAPVILSAREAVTTGGSGSFYYRITASSSTTTFGAAGLPGGLTLDPATGIITGSPTEAGRFTVVLSATNSFGTGQMELILTVTGTPAYASTSLPLIWTLGRPVPGRLFASGNPTFAATGLPPGTRVDPLSGAILGTPEKPGTYHPTFTFTNSFGTATQALEFGVSNVAAWGSNDFGNNTLPAGLALAKAVAAGQTHSLALKSGGTVAAWGNNHKGQTTVPAGLSGVISISAGMDHSLASRNDGTVVAWGDNTDGQSSVPAGLSGVVAVTGGGFHSLALKSDGTVAAWGRNEFGQSNVPANLSGVMAIAAGYHHSLALKSDGTVVAWGNNSWGQATIPAGLAGVTAIAAGDQHSLALKSDGTVAVWGADFLGQGRVPANLSGVVAIAGGLYTSMALKNNGTIVAWGSGSNAADLPGGIKIAKGSSHSLGLTGPQFSPPTTTSVRVTQALSHSVTSFWPDITFSADPLPTGLILNSATGVISGSVAVAGRYDIALTATHLDTGLSGQQTLKLYVVDANFAAWQARHFTALAMPEAKPEADPDTDGMANLLEYARGTDPLAQDTNSVSLPVLNAQGGLEVHMEVLAPAASELNVRAWFAPDPVFANPQEVPDPTASETLANGYQRIRFTDPSTVPSARRFGRLLISLRDDPESP